MLFVRLLNGLSMRRFSPSLPTGRLLHIRPRIGSMIRATQACVARIILWLLARVQKSFWHARNRSGTRPAVVWHASGTLTCYSGSKHIEKSVREHRVHDRYTHSFCTEFLI